VKYTVPRGTRDILPDESYSWRYILDHIISIARLYNYEEIKTPIFESAGLFLRAVGEETDIVEKEMYTFEDKGGRSLALRPEGTASIARAYIQNQATFRQQKVTKLFYQGPMFRYERPQTGRYRQFYQFGIEAIGSISPFVDAEVMMLGIHILKALGVQNVNVAINSVGCEVCRPVIREQVKQFVGSILSELCDDCKRRFDRNPFRILDCKQPKCQTYFAGMPEISNVLCQPCRDHFLVVIGCLDSNNVTYTVDQNLVRGLDYYTKTVFEIQSPLLGSQNTILGGGRYDNLISEIGGRKTPSIGFAIGLDRLFLVLNQLDVVLPSIQPPDFFFIGLDQAGKEKALQTMTTLRSHHIKCEFAYKQNKIGDGLKEATSMNARHAIIIGEDEIENGTFSVKNLEDKSQIKVQSVDEIIELFKERN
jgi:histidyl-tRNA synthetase